MIVDVDKAEIKKLKMNIDIPICADARAFVQEFINNLDMVQPKERSGWMSSLHRLEKEISCCAFEILGSERICKHLCSGRCSFRGITENDVLVPGSSGSCSEITLQAFRAKNGQRILNTPGMGAMGFGLPASIGACLASGRSGRLL